jgi:hypothetical protein
VFEYSFNTPGGFDGIPFLRGPKVVVNQCPVSNNILYTTFADISMFSLANFAFHVSANKNVASSPAGHFFSLFSESGSRSSGSRENVAPFYP